VNIVVDLEVRCLTPYLGPYAMVDTYAEVSVTDAELTTIAIDDVLSERVHPITVGATSVSVELEHATIGIVKVAVDELVCSFYCVAREVLFER